MSLQRKVILTFLLLILIGVGFLAGYFLAKHQLAYVCPPQKVNFSLFWEAWDKLQEKFVDKGKLDVQKMIYGAISGMTKSLEDPYTVFLSPQQTKTFIESIKGAFEGVGMEIGIRKGQLQVITPLEGTPAQKAGLRAGDKIIKVDGTLTADLTLDEVVNLIRGPKGTEVTLTIFRKAWKGPKEIKIVRAVIEIPSLKWELKQVSHKAPIAYLKLYHFTEKARFDFRKAAFEILNSPTQKIILDLRNNPGGYLEVAQNIAGWFLKKGDVVTIEDFGKKREQKIYKARGPSKFLEYPMVILINRGSASGSEILAGALRDNRGILLIGEKSFGKGSVQELEELTKGSLKITIANWLTPNRKLITDKGLTPDIKVQMTEKDYAEGKDPQLEKAIEILNKKE